MPEAYDLNPQAGATMAVRIGAYYVLIFIFLPLKENI
jgi:hypothetical protein